MKKNRDWWLKMRIGKENDARVKLSDEDREYIRKLYKKDGLPIREIARLFEKKCSRRLIQFVIFPERLEVVKKRAIENKNHKKYYSKEKHREYMRNYRKHIRKLNNHDNI